MARRAGVLAAILLLLVCASAVVAQQSNGKGNGNPLDQLWAEVMNLSARIAALERSAGGGGGEEFVVVDSTGKHLGILMGTVGGNHTPHAAFPFQGDWYLVPVVDDFIVRRDLVFATTNCSGTAYAQGDYGLPPALFPRAAVSGPGYTLYVASGPDTTLEYGSYIRYADDQVCLPTPGSYPRRVFPVTAAMTLGAFTPPFSIERTTFSPQ